MPISNVFAELNMPNPSISIEITGKLPPALDFSLANYLRPAVNSSLTNATTQLLRSIISQKKNPNYEEYWSAFSYLYYSSNYLKAYLAAIAISGDVPKKDLAILDLGCGSGASTAGFISGLSSTQRVVRSAIGIDNSAAQLKVFNAVTSPWLSNEFGAKVASFQSDMMAHCKNISDIPDVILLSYSATELAAPEKDELASYLSGHFSLKGSLVVIIDSDSSGRGLDLQILQRQRVLIPYDNVIFECPGLEGLGLNEPPKFAISKTGHWLAAKYFESWKTHDLEILRKIFDKDCIYRINGEKTINGINALQQYWIHNSVRQQSITTDYRVLSENKNRIFIEWHASFLRSDTCDRRHLDGFMEYKINSGKIIELVEYYSQRYSPA